MVRGVESAVLGGVLVGVHFHVERLLDSRNRAFDLHIHGIAGSANDREIAVLRETNHGLIVLLSWTKARGELRHGEEMPVVRAGGVVHIFQKSIQAGLIPEGEHNVQLQDLIRRKAPERLCPTVAYRFPDVMSHHGLSLGIDGHDGPKRDDCEGKQN